MAKTSIENLKGRFKKGMFPTEGDFGNVFDSYVHKDDSIDADKVTTDNGSKTLTTLLQELPASVKEQVLEEIEIPEVPEGISEFMTKVNSFLEDADASDTTINKWQEIESFLAGITDTETLSGLLADLKQEILDEIPEQKEYTAGDGISISDDGVISATGGTATGILRIDDLDASDAAVGTIALYGGATNDKYIHGFFYEKGEGGSVIPAGAPLSVSLGGSTTSPLYHKRIVNTGKMVNLQPWVDNCPSWSGASDKLDMVVAKTGSTMGHEAVTEDGSLIVYYAPMDSNNYLAFYDGVEKTSYGFDQFESSLADSLFADGTVTTQDISLPGGGASWTVLSVMNVIG